MVTCADPSSLSSLRHRLFSRGFRHGSGGKKPIIPQRRHAKNTEVGCGVYELAFIDLDGTLLDPAGAVTSRARDALTALAAHGVRVILASGRPPRMVRRFQADLGLDGPAICYNGAFVSAARVGGTLWECRLSRENALAALDVSRDFGVAGILCEAADTLTGEGQEALLAQAQREKWGLCPGVGLEDALQDGAHKLIAVCPPGTLASLAARLRSALGERIELTISAPGSSWLEILPAGANKAAAAGLIGRLLELDLASAVAFGDAENDAALLAGVGLGVAMANGAPEAIAAARRLAPPNHEDGLARVVEELLAAG